MYIRDTPIYRGTSILRGPLHVGDTPIHRGTSYIEVPLYPRGVRPRTSCTLGGRARQTPCTWRTVPPNLLHLGLRLQTSAVASLLNYNVSSCNIDR